jgi:hypothetical protein
MRRSILLWAALAALWGGTAAAQSVQSVLEAFDYGGRWAPDCRQPASDGNPVLHVSVLHPGLAEHRYDFGGSRSEVNQIYEARQTGPNELTLLIKFRDGRIREQVLVRNNDRIRTMSYRTPGGEVVTRDGIILNSKVPTLTLEHCR